MICFCITDERAVVTNDATKQGYFPEWLLSGMRWEDDDVFWSTQAALNQNQVDAWFGLASNNKKLRKEDWPWYAAVREVDPSMELEWWREREGGAFYRQLLLLASGIQMAGPNLTPASFQQGLFGTRFPNPGSGAQPYFQGHVGFGPGDHSMLDDLALVYWSEAAERSDGSRRGYRYIDRGARWSLGRWPKGELPFFDPTQPVSRSNPGTGATL